MYVVIRRRPSSGRIAIHYPVSESRRGAYRLEAGSESRSLDLPRSAAGEARVDQAVKDQFNSSSKLM
jgi:hypothetical protein